MRHRGVGSLRYGIFAMVAVITPLAGCSTADLGGLSAFGTSQQQVADLPDVGSYTADSALSEARTHFRSSDYGYSAALYKRVVELSPKSVEGYVGLAASYDQLRRFDLSDRVYGSLYTLSGGTAQYYNNVGYSYELRGNLTAALTSFRKAQKLDPNNLVVANNLQILATAAAPPRA